MCFCLSVYKLPSLWYFVTANQAAQEKGIVGILGKGEKLFLQRNLEKHSAKKETVVIRRNENIRTPLIACEK